MLKVIPQGVASPLACESVCNSPTFTALEILKADPRSSSKILLLLFPDIYSFVPSSLKVNPNGAES